MKMLLSLCCLSLVILNQAGALLSDNFNSCRGFFYRSQAPEGFQGIAKSLNYNPADLPDGIEEQELRSPAYICQMFEKNIYFASLYDRGRRIPLYSAYILEREVGASAQSGRRYSFQLEPQLAYRGLDGNMAFTTAAKQEIKNYNKLKNIDMSKRKNQSVLDLSQAVLNDYNKSGYERGHLNPYGHHTTKGSVDATFTLTNIVPQYPSFNRVWGEYEKTMLTTANRCSKMYVVTGVIPGNSWINDKRVNVPSHVWNAYCCVDNNDNPITSGGAIKENVDVKTDSVNPISLAVLQQQLYNIYRGLGGTKNVEIFQNNCVRPPRSQSV